MEDRMMKFYSKESNMLALHAMHGHLQRVIPTLIIMWM